MQTDREPDGAEALRIGEGWKQWHGRGIAGAPLLDPVGVAQDPLSGDNSGFDTEHSPLLYLASAAPLLTWPQHFGSDSAAHWRWLPRIPFLACGVFLGASLWCVARRLCRNTGGFVALTFYCFSPSLLQASAVWHSEPEIVAAWGAFGAIFTAIAVAHTLYAPREVVLWNWRRIVLLGISLAIAVGSQFSLIILAPMALAFMLYLAPTRRLAALAIWAVACGIALLLGYACYFFHAAIFWQGMRHANFLNVIWRAFRMRGNYLGLLTQLGRCGPALVLALPVALLTYLMWRRTRYFG